ncbi:MAG: helix-turn-helix domain-containing protein [Terriglobales bacterium]
MKRVVFDHTGSRFDSFLRDEGIFEDAEAVAVKRVIAWKLQQAMKAKRISKQSMAKQLRTSRSQLDRLLDPTNVAVSLNTITRAARAVGKHVKVSLTDGESLRGRGRRAPVAVRATAKRSAPATG